MLEGPNKLVIIKSDARLDEDGKQILATLKHISKESFNVYLICPPGPLSAEAKLVKNIDVINVPIGNFFYFKSYFALKNALQLIRSKAPIFKPTIIHTYGFWAAYWTAFIKFEEFLFVHSISYKKFDRKILNSQNLLVVPFTYLSERLSTGYSVAKDKIRLIPLAVDVESIKPHHYKKMVKHVNNAPIIGIYFEVFSKREVNFVLNYLRGMHKIYSLAQINIITEESWEKAQEIFIKHRVNHFVRIGSTFNLKNLISKWDLFIDYSADHEKAVMAMFAGVPTLMMKKAHSIDTITHKKHGLHYHANDAELLCKKSTEVLKNPALAAKLRREAKEHARKFSFANVAKILEEEYIRLLER